MDIGTIVGLFLGWSLILVSIMIGGDLRIFIDLPSLLITLGGTLAVTLTRHQLGEVIGAAGVLIKTIIIKAPHPERVITQLVDMANIARKEGILALERVKSEDPFMQSAINHCVDGADIEFLTQILNKELEYLSLRHERGRSIFETMGEYAPAFGLIGTIIGLVQMLANLSEPSAIGPGMAIALITTLYGALLANLVFLPIAGKLGDYSKDEQLVRRIIIDGVIGIQKGINPRMLHEALKASLPPKQRE